MAVLDLRTIRYINLLDNTARVKTKKCFIYNNAIIFAVPGPMISKAIGPHARNIKHIQEKLGKRIRVIKEASGVEDSERLVRDIVAPINFKSLEVRNGVLVLTAGGIQSKAALIGRNRRREDELKQILKDTFGMDLKIV
jgi:transcription antitermination factor NusA-like protein